jgi:hypothetical protein
MKVGFTGTRDGMSNEQRRSFCVLLKHFDPLVEFHHGCCIGADSDAANFVQLPYPDSVIGHPCTMRGMTDAFAVRMSKTMLPVKPPLARNRDIVDACEVLIACPKGPEELRSGTWATVRYARKQKKRIIILWPDGSVSEERHEHDERDGNASEVSR